MKNATACAKKLSALMRKLGTPAEVEHPESDDPIAVLVLSFLMWESTTRKALTAYSRIRTSIVDYNDLRVSMPYEMEQIIGVRYPRALERCQRMRAVLRDIYGREHAVTLDRLNELGKREVKSYMESLEGIVPYVSARVMLFSFDTHAVPVDEQHRVRLIDAGAADPSADVADLGSWLARQVKSGDGVKIHLALQEWIEKAPARSKTSKTAKTRKTTRRTKQTTKKSTSRSASAGGKKSTKRNTSRTTGKRLSRSR